MRRPTSDFKDEEPTLEMLCRKHSYDIIVEDRTYCSHEKDKCLYRDNKKNAKLGLYRCMMLEKRVIYR